ncbi:MAG: response regulator [Pirellulales bacterium]|nr:response regulator [Pirellulales bacterium]
MYASVLIVDDSMLMRRMIAEILTEAGWTVIGEAADGAEAIDLYKQLHPDAVTMGIVMPGINGIETIHGIMEYDPYAKIVVVSALSQTSFIAQAIRAGAQDFVAKPFQPEQLQETMRIVAESSRELVGV